MVYAMFIVFLVILDIYTAHCQTTTGAPNYIYNCSFLNNIYLTNAAVSNQFQFANQTSVVLTASYTFSSSATSAFDFGLIYPFPTLDYLVPFPILLNCASSVRSCQLKTIAGTTLITRDSEPIYVPLTQINFTSTATPLTQMGLYLKQGRYQLRNCSLNDGNFRTDPQTTFNIQIQYEKSVGTTCSPLSDACGPSSLAACSSSSLTCTCLSSSSIVSYSNSFYCADTLNSTNCSIFPTRCVTWCNSTTSSLCVCPIDTVKVQRNNLFICELAAYAYNCSSASDSLRYCPPGQSCTNGQCIDRIIVNVTTTQVTTTSNIINDSTDQRLRIALGVIAGLLGASLIILLGAFCFLRQRQRRRRKKEEKSLSPVSSSSTSSLYISPVQQQRNESRSTNTTYQLPYENNYRRFSPIYRTDSFRQAILSGHRRSSLTNEHISNKRDSFIEILSYRKDDTGPPIYSTLDFVVPPYERSYSNSNKTNNDIYQTIVPSSPSTVLTHTV